MLGRLSRISYRLPAIVVVAVALSALAIGTFSYMESSKEVRRQATDKLVALRDARHANLQRYFRAIEEDLALLAANGQVAQALSDFRAAFGLIDRANRFEEEEALRRVFTTERTGGDRRRLEQASPGMLAYFHAHNTHHAWFETTTKLKGYYDLFLISPTGDVIYTMFKEKDFATNLSFGNWSDTGLAQVFKAGMHSDLVDGSAYVDFAPYEPSAGAPAAFIARKVIRNGQTLGLLALQMPIGRINEIMQVTAGMGESGETYVVGSDHLMHSDSRFSEESTILKTAVKTDGVERALKGETDVATIDDYRGVPVVSAFRPFFFKDAKWALMAEIDVAEVQRPIDAMRNSIIFIGLGLTLLVAAGGMVFAGSITRPLAALSDAITEFRQTRIPPELPQTARTDEIGEIARGFDVAAKEIVEYIDFINLARDELVQGEADLKEREERIRSLLDVSPLGFTLVRPSGEVLMANAALAEITGHDLKIGQALNAADVYKDPADRKAFIDTLMSGGEISAYEVEWKHADGSPIWITLSAKMIDYLDEKAILTWVDDITERKTAEAEIAAKEAQLRMAMENMPGAMVVVDEDLRIVLVNDTYADYYGDPDGLVKTGASMTEIIRAEIERGTVLGEGDVDEILEERLQSYKSGEVVYFADLAQDGRHLQLTRTPAPGGHTISVAIDVTERKKAEEEVAKQKAMLELVLEAMDQGITMFDGDLKLTMFNSKAPDLLNTPPHLQQLGASFRDWYRQTARELAEKAGKPIDEAALEARLEEQLDTVRKGEASIYERPTVDDRTMEIRRNPVDGGGFVSTFTDITERKKSERIIANAMALINESIQYASKIQRSLLPSEADMASAFADHMVIWEPKDVVGGDIYHLRHSIAGPLLMVTDCTGHGVPGAFMTMIATGALDQALIEILDGDPAALLQRINQLVKGTLGQDGEDGESDDGFECGLCLIDKPNGRITYAGARFELWQARNGEIEVIKGNKAGIGYRRTDANLAFTNHTIDIQDGDAFYIVTDGIVDQVGGEKRRAFGKRRAREAIVGADGGSLTDVSTAVAEAFGAYQRDEERRDDVTVVGFKP